MQFEEFSFDAIAIGSVMRSVPPRGSGWVFGFFRFAN